MLTITFEKTMSTTKEQEHITEVMDVSDNQSSSDIKEPEIHDKEIDDATVFVSERRELYGDVTPEEEKTTIRKNDYILLPILFFTCTLGAVDKVSLGTAAIYGLRETTNLTGDQYSWLGSVIFIGSLFGVWPMSFLMLRFPLGKVLASASLAWSTFTLLLPACHNFGGLLALRILMGIVEAAIVPSATLMISRFYVKKQQPVRLSIVFAFGSSFINGFLSWLVGYFGDELPKWKYLFLLVGSISFAWSLFMLYFLPNSPMNAVYLNDKQRYILTKRVLQNSTGVQTNDFKWYQAKEAVLDIKAYIIFFFNVGINIPNGGLSTFSAIIINNLGFDAKESSLMTIPTGAIASGSTIFFNYLSGRYTNKRCIIAVISLLIPIVGASILYGVDRSKVGPQLLGLYLLYFYFSPYVTMMSLSQANTSGNTKRSVTFGCINYLGYAVGALIGPKTFTEDQAPQYTGGFIAMLVAYCACILLACVYWIVCTLQNRSKLNKINSNEALLAKYNEQLEKPDQEKVLLDLTDKQQEIFLYTK